MAERTVMMVFDDREAPQGIQRRAVPVSRVREFQEKYKSANARVDTRALSGGQRVQKFVADVLPMAGQVVGDIGGKTLGAGGSLAAGMATSGVGLLGAPAMVVGGGAAGGALGGAAGQAAREAMYENMGLGDAPGTVLGEAAWGAGGSVGGQIVGNQFVRRVSPFLMKMALGFKNPYVTEGVLKEAVAQRLPVKAARSEGVAGKLLENAIKVRQAAADFASNLGGRASQRAVNTEVGKVARTAIKEGEEDVGKKILARLKMFATKEQRGPAGTIVRVPKPAQILLSDAQKIVTRFDKRLAAYYAKVNKGVTVPFDQLPAREQFFKTTADELRGQIRRVVDQALTDPGAYEKLSAEVGKMGGLTSALKYAANTPRFSGPQSLAGVGLATGTLLQAAGHEAAGPMVLVPSAAGLLATLPEVTSRAAYWTPDLVRYMTPAARAGYEELRPGPRNLGDPTGQPFYNPTVVQPGQEPFSGEYRYQ